MGKLHNEKQVGAPKESGEHVVLVSHWKQLKTLVPIPKFHHVDNIVGPADGNNIEELENREGGKLNLIIHACAHILPKLFIIEQIRDGLRPIHALPILVRISTLTLTVLVSICLKLHIVHLIFIPIGTLELLQNTIIH